LLCKSFFTEHGVGDGAGGTDFTLAADFANRECRFAKAAIDEMSSNVPVTPPPVH
jgi:hypothetical protein